MTAHTPIRTPTDSQADELDRMQDSHAYSARCNCDACFEAWLAMPEPTPAEREAMARAFSLAIAPSGGGELPTDWPAIIFPDLDRISDDQLKAHSKQHRKFNRENQL